MISNARIVNTIIDRTQTRPRNPSPSKSRSVAGMCCDAPSSVAGGTLGSRLEVAVKTDGREDTVVLPPGYGGGADEIGDKLVALLRQA